MPNYCLVNLCAFVSPTSCLFMESSFSDVSVLQRGPWCSPLSLTVLFPVNNSDFSNWASCLIFLVPLCSDVYDTAEFDMEDQSQESKKQHFWHSY